MTTTNQVDTQLLLSVLKIAKEQCNHGNWDKLETTLKAAWEDLRAEDTPP